MGLRTSYTICDAFSASAVQVCTYVYLLMIYGDGQHRGTSRYTDAVVQCPSTDQASVAAHINDYAAAAAAAAAPTPRPRRVISALPSPTDLPSLAQPPSTSTSPSRKSLNIEWRCAR